MGDTVPPSVCQLLGAEGAWLACVRVSARVRGTVTDSRGGGNSGTGGRGRDSTMMTRPRLLVTLFRVCYSRRRGYFASLAPLPTRVAAAVAIGFVIFLVVRA